ncbi:hypothetical protein, partial [Nocardia sp. NRRL S-836]|uniref:hypothetical protein n=1 Tax=Nocardia sp. NRRL S-836 TaxID=1519492 RepID=UPI0006BFB2D4
MTEPETRRTGTSVGGGPTVREGGRRLPRRAEGEDQSEHPLRAFRGTRLIVVANHLSSQRGDDPTFGRFQPPRTP